MCSITNIIIVNGVCRIHYNIILIRYYTINMVFRKNHGKRSKNNLSHTCKIRQEHKALSVGSALGTKSNTCYTDLKTKTYIYCNSAGTRWLKSSMIPTMCLSSRFIMLYYVYYVFRVVNVTRWIWIERYMKYSRHLLYLKGKYKLYYVYVRLFYSNKNLCIH